MIAGWFTQPRADLNGDSTDQVVARAIELVETIPAPVSYDDDAEAFALRGHAIEGARYQIDDLANDPPFRAVADDAGVRLRTIMCNLIAERLDLVRADLERIKSHGCTADLPAGEALARDTIADYARSIAEMDREFPNIPTDGEK